MNRVIAGEPVTDSELDANDIRQGIVGLFQTLIHIAGTVVFIMWLHRAYKNVDAVAPEERRCGHRRIDRRPVRADHDLFRPKQVVNDVWRAGRPCSDTEGREPGWLLLSWWLL